MWNEITVGLMWNEITVGYGRGGIVMYTKIIMCLFKENILSCIFYRQFSAYIRSDPTKEGVVLL